VSASDLSPALRTLLGKTIAERYTVDAWLASGATTEVFAGHHTWLGHRVAIKVLRPEGAQQPDLCARFEREARAAANFDHPHCVSVFDFGRTDRKLPFMVLPRLRGHPLAHVLPRRAPLPASQAIAAMLGVLRGLAYVHERAIFHRNLRPQTIFVVVDDEGRESLKIHDFGAAKHPGLPPGTPDLALHGNPAYASPEQLSGAPLDARSDLYSAGAIAYEMLEGHPPLPGRNTLERMAAAGSAPAMMKTPAAVAGWLARLLARAPAERFASAALAIEAGEDVADRLRKDPTPWRRLLQGDLAPPRDKTPPLPAPTPPRSNTVSAQAVDDALRSFLELPRQAAQGALRREVFEGTEPDPERDL